MPENTVTASRNSRQEPMTTKPIVDIRELSHSYGERQALDNLNFTVNPGELFGILGPNGGGKSTTFRILTTLMRPTSGTASVCGHDVVQERDAVRREIGVAFQSPALDVKLTVRENLMHQAHLYGLSGAPMRERIEGALGRIGLAERSGELVETLSGGLRRRIELAKALISRPKLLLLDEPTVGLDPRARGDFWRFIKQLRSETGMTVVTTTHLLREATYCDRITILDSGRLVALDSPDALCAQIEGDVVHLEVTDAQPAKEKLTAALQAEIGVDGSTLRVVVPNGHEFAVRAKEVLGDTLESVSIAKPTLADVFEQKTGHTFANDTDAGEAS